MFHETPEKEIISLEKRRYLKGVNNENWREHYPDHCVLLHGDRVLTFSKNLSDLTDVLYDYEIRGLDVEKIAILFIDTTETIVEQEARLAIEGIKWRNTLHVVNDEYIDRRNNGVFRPREHIDSIKDKIAFMRKNMQNERAMDRNAPENGPFVGEAYAEETHQQTTQALNDRYTPKQWDAIIYQAIKARDTRILHDLNDPLLNTNKDHLFIAAKAVQDMQRVFSRVTFSPFSDEESA